MKNRFYLWEALLLIVSIIPVMGHGIGSDISKELKEAERLYAAGEVKPALELLDNLLKRYPDEAEVNFKTAVYRIANQGRNSNGQIKNTATTINAVSHIETATNLKPNNLLYKSTYAMVLSDIGEEDKAISVFRGLFRSTEFRVDSEYRHTIVNFAITLQRRGLVEEAEDEYVKSLEETGYDERIAFSYVGFLSMIAGLERVVRFSEKYREKKGFSGRVQYAVCYESAAMKHYQYALHCFDELAKNPLASTERRERAALDAVNIGEKYLDVK